MVLAFGRDPAGGIGQSRLASGKKQGPGRQGGQGQFMPMGGIKLGLICLPRQLRCILNHHNVSPVEEYVTFVTAGRSEEHTSELQSLMRISYAVFCLKKKKKPKKNINQYTNTEKSTNNKHTPTQ